MIIIQYGAMFNALNYMNTNSLKLFYSNQKCISFFQRLVNFVDELFWIIDILQTWSVEEGVNALNVFLNIFSFTSQASPTWRLFLGNFHSAFHPNFRFQLSQQQPEIKNSQVIKCIWNPWILTLHVDFCRLNLWIC